MLHGNEYADLYLRLSIDRERKTAIERQEHDCREWADHNGLKVREVHIDRGRSGYKRGVERRGFDSALAAITAGVVSTLIVWKLDRLSRQGVGQVGLILDDLEKVGGRLVSVQDSLDSSQENSRFVIATLSELARAESANLGLRVRSAKQHLRSSGRWIGGPAPYGLKACDGRLYADPETGPVVREIARRILEGATLMKVTLWLNKEGIPAPRGGMWSVGSVSHLLRGPATAGLLPETVKKADGSGYTRLVRPWRDPNTGETVSVMADGQDPLISPADQSRISALFAERSLSSPLGHARGALQRESRHLLTGILRCLGCGSRMSKQGNSYRCQTARLGRTCAAPGGAYQVALDDAVTQQWFRRLTTTRPDDPLVDAVADRWAAQRHPGAAAKRTSVLLALDQERGALAALDEDHYVRRTIDRRRYVPLAEALARRIEGLERTLAANPVPEADMSELLDPVRAWKSWCVANAKERRDLLRLALLEVRVSQGKRGQRFDPATRLTFVWATSPPTVTGAAAEVVAGDVDGVTEAPGMSHAHGPGRR